MERLWLRRLRSDERFWMSLFSLLTLLIAVAHLKAPRTAVPSLLIVVLLSASFVMSARSLVNLEVVILFALIFMAIAGSVSIGQAFSILASALLVMWWVRFRSRHGLAGTQSDTMLIEVRERIESLGTIPQLPRHWNVEAVVRPAGNSQFSGDFVIFADGQQDVMELALVDVSGKGRNAAARALLLQSSFGGLIGSLSFGEFLPAANSFLLRQQWGEGFATAAHLRINFTTGLYFLSLAGHPPAAYFAAGTSRWQTIGKAGDVLGVTTTSRFPVESAVLNPGDALLLYTDGVIEVPGRDLLFGIDKLLGGAEELVARSWKPGVRSLLDSLHLGDGDDASIVLVHRLSSGLASPI